MSQNLYLTDDQMADARKLFRKVVLQGYCHKQQIETVLGVLVDEFAREYTEDNDATRREFLRECFEHALNYPVEREPKRPWFCWHYWKYVNRWWPQKLEYGPGHYCAKCGKERPK